MKGESSIIDSMETSSIRVELARVTSIPRDIAKLSPSSLIGDRSVVHEIVFEPGSRLQLLEFRLFFEFGLHSAQIHERIDDLNWSLEDIDDEVDLIPDTLRPVKARQFRGGSPTIPW
jgi:hypothetical protein